MNEAQPPSTAPTEAAFIQADVRRDDKGERS